MMILTKCFCDPPNLSPIGFCSAKVWYLRCKSMVFVVRKVGICSAKSGFLRCESMVFAVRKYGICGAKVWYFVGVRVCIAICSQRCCRLSAALLQSVSSCRGPIYRARVYINTHEMEGGECVCGDVNMCV